jgi:OmpA-OmpF porin, OOP family
MNLSKFYCPKPSGNQPKMKFAKKCLCVMGSLAIAMTLLTACGKKDVKVAQTTPTTPSTPIAIANAPVPNPAAATPAQNSPPAAASLPAAVGAEKGFNFDKLPVSEAQLGQFPYFGAPTGYKYYNATKRGFDKEYFIVDGSLFPVEGESFRADISPLDGSSSAFLAPQVLAAYTDAITKVGGVKLEKKPLIQEELSRLPVETLNKHGTTLSLSYLNSNETYVIRNKAGEIWIQTLLIDASSGKIAVIRKGSVPKAQVAAITADQMKGEMAAKGRIVLYINFDVDKAVPLPDSVPVLQEVYKLMETDGTLKIQVEGHTDNSGDVARNMDLSKERARAIKDKLVAAGIDAARLKAEGFGSSRPLSKSNTDAGRAQNRRVELVNLAM